MDITYCPCKNEKKKVTNCLPDDIVYCCKEQNKYKEVAECEYGMGITYLPCRKNNCDDKKECKKICITKIGTLNYGSKCNKSDDAHVNNVCYIDGNRILVCGSDTKYPLWSYHVDCNGCVTSDVQFWNIFQNKDLSFAGKLFDGYGVIPKKCFEILYFREHDCDYKKIKFDGCDGLSDKLVRAILNYDYISQCNKKKNFKLIGFFVRCNQVYFAVQLTGKKKNKVRKLYLLKSSFDCASLSFCDDVTLLASYNIYKLAHCHNISTQEASKMRVTGITYKNNELFILTSSGSRGYLWNVDLPLCAPYKSECIDSKLNFLSYKKDKLRFNKSPRGVTHISNGELMVICDHTDCNKKHENSYYIINI